LTTSREILNEVADVLRYERLARLHMQTEDAVYRYIVWLYEHCELITLDPALNMPIRDRSDAAVMQTAVLGSINVLCTSDKDFHNPPASDLLARCGIDTVSARELLMRL
jgi:putative PIN family toxin of toxin-antitoxin system